MKSFSLFVAMVSTPAEAGQCPWQSHGCKNAAGECNTDCAESPWYASDGKCICGPASSDWIASGQCTPCSIEATSHWAMNPSFHWPMDREVFGSTVPFFRGKIWIIGGLTRPFPSEPINPKNIDIYDTDTQQWSVQEFPMNSPSFPQGSHAVTFGDTIYVALFYGRAVQFDGNQWIERSFDYGDDNLPHLATARHNNDDTEYLYVFFSEIMEWNVQRSVDGINWYNIPKTPFDRHCDFSTVVVDGALFVISYDGVASYNGSENPWGGNWTRQQSMLRPRAGHGAAVFDGRIYVFGGGDDSVEVGTVTEGAVTWALMQGGAWSRPSGNLDLGPGVMVNGDWWGIGDNITAFNPLNTPQVPGGNQSLVVV